MDLCTYYKTIPNNNNVIMHVVMVNMCLSVTGLWLPAPNKPATLGEIRADQTTGRKGICQRQESSPTGFRGG